MQRKKYIRLALLITGPLLLLVLLFTFPSIVTIESEKGAEILLTDSKDGSFKKIGETKVTRLFFKKPAAIYVSAKLNGKETVSSASFKRFTHQSIKLGLIDTIAATKITDGAVMDVIFNGTAGQGIVYGQDTVVNFRTDTAEAEPNPELLSIPYTRKIIWYDYDNFVYLGGQGIGQYKNGRDAGNAEVGTSLSGDVSVDASQTTDTGAPLILDIAKVASKPLVLLSPTNVFTSTDMGSRLNAITSFDSRGGERNIFATEDSIIRTSTVPLEHSTEEREIESERPSITLDVYSYTGDHRGTHKLDDDSTPVSIVEKNKKLFVLTLRGLYEIENGNIKQTELYFGTPADMVSYKGEVVVLAKNGIWKIADNLSFQKLFDLGEYGEGLKNSFSINNDNQLIFGTVHPASESNKSATFITSF